MGQLKFGIEMNYYKNKLAFLLNFGVIFLEVCLDDVTGVVVLLLMLMVKLKGF